MAKAKHWTQRPENKARLAKQARDTAKKRAITRRNGHKHDAKREQGQEGEATESQVAFAFGSTQTWLQQYARNIGVAEQPFTFQVADLLRRSAVRKA